MLIVHLEAWTPDRQDLGELLIRNDGTGDTTLGHDAVTLVSEPYGPARSVREARVEHFPRTLGAWHLVQCALVALGIPPVATPTQQDLGWARDAAHRLGLGPRPLPAGEEHTP